MNEIKENYISSPEPQIEDDNLRRIIESIEVDSPEALYSQESSAKDNPAINSVKKTLFNTSPVESLNAITLSEDVLLVANEHPYKTTCINDVIILPLEQPENDHNDGDTISLDNNVSTVETENELENTKGSQEESASTNRKLSTQLAEDDRKQSTRKRKLNPQNWKCNVRKEQREHGEEYINIKGKVMKKREVKSETCRPKCSFKCFETFSEEDRRTIHKQFWKLSDTKKTHFFSKYVLKIEPVRKRTKKEESRKKNVFHYYLELNSEKSRVCKEFFCNTLSISQQRVYYFFRNIQNLVTNVPRSPLKGKHTKRVTFPEKIEEVRNHIQSFPTINSHYCRANSQKKYLEATLNITKMYDLYRAKHNNPVTHAVYRKVFNNEFNLSFFRPKKDLCDKCEAFKILISPSEDQQILHNEHLQRKEEGRTERNLDKERNETDVAVLTFDLENVFSLPKSEVSNFYYKSKLCVFNLTAHCNVNKTIYNCIWHEFLAGRDSNAIASAVVRILETLVKDLPNLKRVILWSDSCVPQNKNSIMSLALMNFIRNTDSNIEHIEQKFSEPGHGNLQDVDAAHSVIERSIKNIDIYSPLGLVRVIMNIRSKNKFKVLQMKNENFLNFKSISSQFKFNDIPYSKVKHIMYDASLRIKFKNRFTQDVTEEVTICRQKTPRSAKRRKDNTNDTNLEQNSTVIKVPMLKEEKTISARKHKDLSDMLKYMEDGTDKTFYNTIIRNLKIKN